MPKNNINIKNSSEKTIIVERIEDGHAHLEIVKDGDIVNTKMVDESVIADTHIHDGMVVEISPDGMLEPDSHASAIREKEVHDKIEQIGRRAGEKDKN